MVNNTAYRAGILGATGYTGQELARLLSRHPRFEIGWATSEAEAGAPVRGTSLRYRSAGDVEMAEVDVVFSCLPHGQSGEWAVRAYDRGVKAIDLSGDLRDGSHGAVYGLPELWREEIRGAALIANPGCYPTGVLLSLAPAVDAGLLDTMRPVVIDAASGVTGAGRTAKRELLFAEVADDYRAYGVGNRHRHVPEIVRGLARAGEGEAPPFIFTPHLLPVQRGILETMHLPLIERVSAAEAVALWSEAYAGESFVDVLPEGLPSLRDVVGTNRVAIGFADVEVAGAPMLLLVAALDNLVKGAAGQAVQNANLLLGLDEGEGLSQ